MLRMLPLPLAQRFTGNGPAHLVEAVQLVEHRYAEETGVGAETDEAAAWGKEGVPFGRGVWGVVGCVFDGEAGGVLVRGEGYEGLGKVEFEVGCVGMLRRGMWREGRTYSV